MKDTCNYPDGTFIGIITDIQTVEKPYPSVTVTAALTVDGKIAKHQKCFNKPFTNGREAFQNFCEEFDLFSDRTEHRNDYVLELNYAIGTPCTAVLSSDRGFESITPLGDTDLKIAFGLDDCYEKIRWFQPETYCTEKDMANLAPEIREQRLQLKRDLMLIKSVSYQKAEREIPALFQNYRRFPPLQLHRPCAGFIEKIQLKKDRFRPEELTLYCYVAIIDRGHIVHRDYYINRIRSVGRGDYEHFCATLGLLYEEDNPNELIDLCELHNACFVPLTIYLYQSPKSGNLYVNRLMKYSSANFQDEMDMMQFVWAYEHYCNQELGSFDFCEC